MRTMTKTKIYSFLFLLAAVAVFGQQKQLQTSIDSTKIRIGSQANLTLKATVDTSVTVSFPEGKTFGQLEVIESYPVDTLRKGAIYELVKKYGLTQFDSGRYVIPSLPVIINNKSVKSDSLNLEVTPIKVDTLKQKMFDIKDVATGQGRSWLWLYIFIGLIVAGGLGYGIYWFLKNRKKQLPEVEEVVYTSPIEKATSQLQNLEKENLLERGEVKDYYSKLTDIARVYIEEAIHVPAMESTTSELIEAMRAATRRKKMNLSQDTFEQLEKVLRTADMVKFAKSKPLDFEIAEDRQKIEKTIVVIDRSIPEEVEEEEDHSAVWLEMQRKKKLKKRRTLIVSIGTFVVAFVLAFYGVSTAINKSGIFGVPTQELFEGEWIKSEYGFPGVTVETPRVLMRVDAEKVVPKEAMAFIKEMNMFMYGELFDDIYIVVSTASYKQPAEIDLNKAVDGVVKTWEVLGAQNILLKTEEFQTEGGISGIRSYGTMTIPHAITKKPVRAYYELFLFKQQQGLQQVLVMYKDGDEYAPQILERIKKSIELRNLNQQ